MLVYAAIVPHSLELLIASQERKARFPKTTAALERIEQRLCASQPDTIVLLNSHAEQARSACTMDMTPFPVVRISAPPEEECAHLFLPDIETNARLRAASERFGEFVYAQSDFLDGAVLVLLALLLTHLPNVRIVSLTTAHRDEPFHLNAGKLLEEVLTMLPRRFALLVSGDLASVSSMDASIHRARLDALKFDRELLQAIVAGTYHDALEFGREHRRGISQCVLDPAAVLFGALSCFRTSPKLLGYESPFGTGLAVMEFEF